MWRFTEMMPFEKKILTFLLNSYENSSIFRKDNKVKVNISFAFNQKNLPEYFEESSSVYEEIHARMIQLEKKGFLTILWKNGKKNHIINKVILCEQHLSEIYDYVHRVPKSNNLYQTTKILDKWSKLQPMPVLNNFINTLQKRLSQGKSIKEYVDITEPQELEKLLLALKAVEENKEECFIREFSLTHFKDSKYFASLVGKVCKILKEAVPAYRDMENTDILSEYQILHMPSYIYLKGQAEVALGVQENKAINIGAFKNGLGFSFTASELAKMQIKADNRKIHKVYTIENLTSFFRFSSEDSIVIYLGGYHNEARRTLLKRIRQALPQAQYFHFGDIDAGGFYIYHHLTEKTGIPFHYYHMDIQTLQKYSAYCKPLTINDRKRLMDLAQKYQENTETISYMLEHNVKLEQECIRE